MILLYEMKSNLYNAFLFKSVSITNKSTDHYIEGVMRQ